MFARLGALVIVACLLTACGAPASAPSPTATNTAAPTVTTEPTATEKATREPPPPVSGPQVVQNGSFDAGTAGWEHPYGALRHTTYEYYTEPGAARLVTTDASGLGEYRASMGQCIDLSGQLEDWPMSDEGRQLSLEAFINTDAEISEVTLNGIFSNDLHCGVGHVGSLIAPAVSVASDWTRVAIAGLIPDTAKSLHVFVWVISTSESATAYVDDVRAYSPEGEATQ
jgi:hypothetical protein